jgi:hypothetical protein
MCVLIYKPAGASISENILRGCFERNDDGLGIGYSDGSTLSIWRTLKNIDEACKRVEMLYDYPAMIHFRYATHGGVSMDNVHPFWINDNRRALVGHNGVIHITHAPGESDTRSFVSNVLGNMKDGWWNNQIAKTQIEKLLGGSRLAIMEEDGKCTFLNKYQGETTADGVWFSNSQFKNFLAPSARSLPAHNIIAATGLEAPRQVHSNNSQYSWHGERDPFQSKSVVAPKPPTMTGQTPTSAMTVSPALPPMTPATPSMTTPSTTPKAPSLVSSVGGMVSATASDSSPLTTLSGPLHDSEVKAWTDALGIDWINDYAVGYVSMPNGVYGREEYHCEKHVPADIRTAIDPTVSAINAIDLLDAHFVEAKCHECYERLCTRARFEYAAFMATTMEEEDDYRPLPKSRSRRRKGRKEATRTTRSTTESESGSLELVSTNDTPSSNR